MSLHKLFSNPVKTLDKLNLCVLKTEIAIIDVEFGI